MANAAPMSSNGDANSLLDHDDLVALEAPLRRYVLSRTGDPDRSDDIVQETLARTLAAADNLEIQTLTGYAIAVARNEINAHARSDATARRHLPRLLELTATPRPDEVATANESRQALAAALAALPPGTRRLLVAHDVHEFPLAEIAKAQQVRPGTLAAQLHRTRARLRVDYVVALRRATLPTSRCRSVLMAISAADKRQQHALDAGQHLADCTVCDELAIPLLTRDRTLAGFVPWLALGAPQGAIEGFVRRHPGPSTAGTVATAAAGVLVVTQLVDVGNQADGLAASSPASTTTAATTTTTPAPSTASSPGPDAPSPAPVPNLSSFGRPVVPARSQLGSAVSAPAVANGVQVLGVPADEGFWVGEPRSRIWVQMTGQSESALQVRTGMRLSFQGTIVVNDPTFVRDLMLKDAGDQAALEASGIHVVVNAKAVALAS